MGMPGRLGSVTRGEPRYDRAPCFSPTGSRPQRSATQIVEGAGPGRASLGSRSGTVIVSLTALGSRAGAATAARGVVVYWEGRARQRAGAGAGIDPVATGHRGPGAYYADSVEGPGRWFGHGVGPA